MFFYFWRTVAVSMTGTVDVRVRCENCEAAYRFRVARSATGSGHDAGMLDEIAAMKVAERKATDELESRLQSAIEPVPCPSCGWFQRSMWRAYRRKYAQNRFGRMPTAGFVSLAIAAVSFMIGLGLADGSTELNQSDREIITGAFIVAAVTVFLGFSLLIGSLLLRLHLDPNADMPLDERLKLGRQLATAAEPGGELTS
jgi:hypothetical protein